jgi:hypothetical protein
VQVNGRATQVESHPEVRPGEDGIEERTGELHGGFVPNGLSHPRTSEKQAFRTTHLSLSLKM